MPKSVRFHRKVVDWSSGKVENDKPWRHRWEKRRGQRERERTKKARQIESRPKKEGGKEIGSDRDKVQVHRV